MTQTADTFHDEFEQIDDPEPTSTWFVTLTGTIVFIALVLGLCVMYFHADTREVIEREIDPPVQALAQAKSEQMQLLSDYRWYPETQADGKTTVDRLRIPIDQAMGEVAKELASKPATRAAASGGAGQ